MYTNREKEILKLASKEVQSADGKYVRMIDDKILFEERKKAIPNYRERLWEEMKKVIATDSTFFDSENAEGKATGYTKRGETIDESTIEDL